MIRKTISEQLVRGEMRVIFWGEGGGYRLHTIPHKFAEVLFAVIEQDIDPTQNQRNINVRDIQMDYIRMSGKEREDDGYDIPQVSTRDSSISRQLLM